MFIPSIDAMWCECLTFFYKIGFSSFSTRSIVRWLKFERNEFHVFKTSLAINLVLSTLNVTSGTSISFTRDPATGKSSSFILRCVVLCIQTFFKKSML